MISKKQKSLPNKHHSKSQNTFIDKKNNLKKEEIKQPNQVQREDRLEGRHAILEALRTDRTIDKLWVLEGLFERDAVVRNLINECKKRDTLIYTVPKIQLDKLAITNSHQGLIAQVAMQKYVELDELIDQAFLHKKDPILLLVDEIQDAYNLGAIFRIAEAAKLDGIILPKRRQVSLDAVVAKASAGAINHVPACKVSNLVQTIEYMKERGFWLASTRMDGEDIFISKQTHGPLALVIGNEGRGVSPLVSQHCDFHLSIPMLGSLNSLNAAVATGIIVFEVLRKRRYN